MEHVFIIWRENKNTGAFFIERKITVGEEELNEMILESFKKNFTFDETPNIEYTSR